MFQVCSAGKCVILLCSTALTATCRCLQCFHRWRWHPLHSTRGGAWALQWHKPVAWLCLVTCETKYQQLFIHSQVCKQLCPYVRENIWHSKDSATQLGYFPPNSVSQIFKQNLYTYEQNIYLKCTSDFPSKCSSDNWAHRLCSCVKWTCLFLNATEVLSVACSVLVNCYAKW